MHCLYDNQRIRQNEFPVPSGEGQGEGINSIKTDVISPRAKPIPMEGRWQVYSCLICLLAVNQSSPWE